jgi:DUF2950 family protein
LSATVRTSAPDARGRNEEGNFNTKGLKHMVKKPATSHDIRQSMLCVLAILFVLSASLFDGDPLVYAQKQDPAKTKSQATEQATFSTPEESMHALVEAAKAKDHAALRKIFGPDDDQLLSGDPVEDNKDLENFAAAVTVSADLKKEGDTKYTMVVGKNNFPLPIPIVKQGDHWIFDTKAGIEEILNRRIGENELSTVATCRAYVVAQWEYFTEGHLGGNGVAAYAQKFRSTPGEHDGLYWETAEGEKPSPLGELVAAARAEGYGLKGQTQAQANERGQKPAHSPYHGYFFKILTRQGSHAPGGKYSYIINGNMIAGYGLLAYPAKWGNSGVMTFIVNQQGRVYQKNLGPDTAKVASAMTEYDPDPSWKRVGGQ